MTLAGSWLMGPPGLAAFITVALVVLVAGSLVVGRSRRRNPPAALDGAAAQAAYVQMRRSLLFTAPMIPLICVLLVIYGDDALATALLVGGIAVSAISGGPAELRLLREMRERAELGP